MEFTEKTIVSTLPCEIEAASFRISVPEEALQELWTNVPVRLIKLEAIDKDGKATPIPRVKYFKYECDVEGDATVTIVYIDHKER